MKQNIITTAVIALLVGSVTGYWVATEKSGETVEKQSVTSERKPLFYRNPMNPEITSPVPAQDEMGMDYIPVYPEKGAADQVLAGTVNINPAVVQDIGVRTAVAELATLSRNIRSVGRVTYDEQRVARLHPKYDGWVEELFVNRTGDRVRKGDMLLSIYSPQLVASQEEYLLALNNAETLRNSPFADVREGAESLLHSTEQRLKLLDMPAHQITNLKTRREITKGVHIHSPFDGIVMNIGAREGQRLTPETELYMIADLSRVWVIVDIYEDDMPWVRKGDTAKVQVSGIPGRIFTGKVTQIYPYLEAKTRTVKVRMEFDNPDLALKPDMFANVEVLTNRQVNAVTIPAEAIVRTGAQEQVFVQRAPGKFEPRKVVVGVSANGKIQIVDGLDEGEVVVSSAQFLIDSESKLKEATAKMLSAARQQPDDQAEATHGHDMQMEMPMQHDHEGMDMSGQHDMDSATDHESMNMPMHHDHGSMDMSEQADTHDMHQHQDMGSMDAGSMK